MPETSGQWILKHRKALGLLQSEVANRAGVSTSYISTLEREQKHSASNATLRPEPDKVAAIAKAVHGNVSELLTLYGYASATADDSHEITDGVRIIFDGKDIEPDDQAKILELVKTITDGIVAKRKAEAN